MKVLVEKCLKVLRERKKFRVAVFVSDDFVQSFISKTEKTSVCWLNHLKIFQSVEGKNV